MNSNVIFDVLEEDTHQIHNIKSNVQLASGNKFNNQNSKIFSVKNSKRKGDFKDGVREQANLNLKMYTPSKPNENVKCKPKLFYEEEKTVDELLRLKLDFDKAKTQNSETENISKNKPNLHLELSRREEPMKFITKTEH